MHNEKLKVLFPLFSEVVVESMISNDYIGNCERVNCINDVKLLEECGELIAVLSKAIANKENYELREKQINTEVADVIITLAGFIARNDMNVDSILEEVQFKLKRFKDYK